MLNATETTSNSASRQRRSRNDLHLQKLPMNTTAKKTTRNFLSRLYAKESITTSQNLSTTARTCIERPKSSLIKHTTRCVHHRCTPSLRAETTIQKRRFLNKHTISSNRFAAFALATIMTSSSSIPPSSVASAFVPTPVRAKTRVVQMDPSLIQHSSAVSEDFNKILLDRGEFMDTVLDMSSSVATTAATSSASSIFSPEEHHYSLRKVLVRKSRVMRKTPPPMNEA